MNHLKWLWATCLLACIALLPLNTFAQTFDDINDQADKEYEANNYQKAMDLTNKSLNMQVNSRSYFIRADCRYSLNDFEAALSDYDKAIELYSGYYTTDKYKARMYYWRGRTKQKLKQWEDAIVDLTSSITYNYDEAGYAYWNRGNCYYESKKYKEADDDYTKAIDRLSKSEDLTKLYKYRGDCMGRLYKYDDADKMFTRSISYDANFYNAYWSRGFYRNSNYKSDDALEDYRKAISIIEANNGDNNDLASVYRNVALIYSAKGENDDAMEAINKSLKANPNFISGFQTRADIYRDMKKFDKAKADYDNAITLETDDSKQAEMYFERSYELDWKMLDYRSALEDLDKSISMDAKDGMKFWHRAITYDYKKDYVKALADINRSIVLYGDKPAYGQYTLRASIKEKAGDIKGAIGDYQAALKIDNKTASIYYNLGRLFKTKMNNNDLAQTNLTKAMEIAKDDPYSSTGAYAKVVNGQTKEAIQMVLANVEKYKDDSYEYKRQLHNAACIYALSGNKLKALEYLDRSLEAGYDDYDHLVNDRDLVSLTAMPQYKTILVKYKVPQPKW
jgi:tetratricopeptide (TPR) repeat protein